MKKCIECGTVFNASYSACPNCGLPSNYASQYSETSQQNEEPTQQYNQTAQQYSNAPQADYCDNSNLQQDYDYDQNGNYSILVTCPECGKEMSANALKCPHCGKIEFDILDITYKNITENFCSFSGRVTRMEYFGFGLILLFVILPIIIPFLAVFTCGLGAIVGYIAIFIHFIGLTVRRLHDVNRSGWWVLLFPAILFFCFKDSDPYENEYGNSPKYQPEMFR